MQKDLIITIGNVNFYKGKIITNTEPNEQIIYTDDENYRISTNEDLIKACQRIYKLNYED